MIFPIVPTASGIPNKNIQAIFVPFLVIADGKLKVMGYESGLLVVTGSIACKLEDLSSEVLHDCSQVDWGTGTNALSIVSLAEESVDTSNGELKSGPGATGL